MDINIPNKTGSSLGFKMAVIFKPELKSTAYPNI